MAHRGLRKPSSRRSLRPRNQTSLQRTASDTGSHAVLSRSGQQRAASGPEYDADLEHDRSSRASHAGDIASPPREDFAYSVSGGAHETARESASESPAAGSVAHDDPLANAFFERSERHDEVFDDTYVIHQLSRGSRRAMYASLGIFGVSIVCISVYSIYQNWVMPAPVELGATLADIPAVPQPVPAHAASAPTRWQAAQPAPQSAAVAPTAPGTETQLSAATNAAQAEAPAQAATPTASLPAQSTGSLAAAPSVVQGSTLAILAARPAAANAAPEGVASAHLRANAQQLSAAPQAVSAVPQVANVAQNVAPQAANAGLQAKPVESVVRPIARDEAPVAAPDEMQVASAVERDRPSGGLPTSARGGPTYDELVEVGRALSKKNKRVEASEAFRRALIQSPQGSTALSGLGFVYLNADEKQHAREYAQRAVLADASNAEGWIVLGAALELLGDRAGARDAYRNCVEWGQGPYLVECRRVSH